jgi:hypothetical protein
MLSFKEALAESGQIQGKRHVLLGNGFSIACRPDCFTYGRLFDEADLAKLSVAGDGLFASEETTDFEEVIRSLQAAARMADLYETTDPSLADRLREDAAELKRALAETLAKTHPDHVGELDEAEYRAARVFLANFDHIFTVNYDLLLYWTLMQEMEPKVGSDDGFRADPDDLDAPWVTWDSYKPFRQNVFFLHGGLHLFEEGATLKKLTFSRTGIALVEQIRSALDSEAYPLVVTEGTSEEKHAKIRHSDFLAKGLRSLATCGGSLFIHGHSLAKNDAHVLRSIELNKIEALFVSLHGKPDKRANQRIQRRAASLADRRQPNRPLQVHFYDSDSAAVWG